MVQFKKVSLFGQQDKFQLSRAYPAKPWQSAGFSLLETTIAIAILVAAIIGPMALSSQSIRSASVAKNTIMASNLAQEGLELVKNIRLNNRISGRNWMQGLGTCGSANGCFIDPKDLDVSGCSANCAPLKFDDGLGLYNYDSGSDTMFVRVIRTSDVGSDEVKVSSSITWSDKFGNHDFTLLTSMLDW